MLEGIACCFMITGPLWTAVSESAELSLESSHKGAVLDQTQVVEIPPSYPYGF